MLLDKGIRSEVILEEDEPDGMRSDSFARKHNMI
jgi:hypothetical protein